MSKLLSFSVFKYFAQSLTNYSGIHIENGGNLNLKFGNEFVETLKNLENIRATFNLDIKTTFNLVSADRNEMNPADTAFTRKSA